MDELFESYETTAEDRAQLKRDTRYHPRTSHSSLKEYARALRAAGDTVAPDEVQEALTWLNMHQSELPSEIENDAGQTGNRGSIAISADVNDTYTLTDDATKYEEHGLYYVAECHCYVSLESILTDRSDPEIRERYLACGMTDDLYTYAMAVRGARYAARLDDQRRRARWQGMEEWDAVAKADEHLREGAKLSPAAENANALPSLERLEQLFTVANGELVWAVAGRGITKGRVITSRRVRVDGKLYVPKRIIYKLTHGTDPKSAVVTDELKLREYHSVSGASVERDRSDIGNKFDARVKLNGKSITVGTYSSEEQANEACSIFLRSLERGL